MKEINYNGLPKARVLKVLENKYLSLKDELTELINQWQNLQEEVHPRLMHMYNNFFGKLEFDLRQKSEEFEFIELKYKLLNTSIMKNGALDNFSKNQINDILTKENDIKDIKTEEDKRKEFFNSFDKPIFNPLVPECELNDRYELTKLYRDLVKIMHPDTNGINVNFKRYWHKIQEAYRDSNIERLRLYHQTLCPNNYKEIRRIDAKISALQFQIKELEYNIFKERRKLSKIHDNEPFSIEKNLSDKFWINRRKRELKDQIYYTDIKLKQSQRRLNSLLSKLQYSFTA